MRITYLICLVLLIFLGSCSTKKEQISVSPFALNIKFNDSVFTKNINGRLLVFMHEDTSANLIFGPDAHNPQPCFAYDVIDHAPNKMLEIDSFSDFWFLPEVEKGKHYGMQIILDLDSVSRGYIAPGNGYVEKKIVYLEKDVKSTFEVSVNHQIRGWEFYARENIREVSLPSKHLSDFWGYLVKLKAAVVFPDSYYMNTEKNYPVVFVFHGWAGSHCAVTYGDGQFKRYGMNTTGKDKIFVYCYGEFKQGYHHFTNSANNGPWADAFIEELLPYIENKYRIRENSESRFLMGQSSGAWTALWLQLNYPEMFNGAFAASPDPVDFRAHAFNIYAENANYYYPQNADSLALVAGEITKRQVLAEEFLGEFGQHKTWEATFGPRSANGKCMPLYDRESGKIDSKVAINWRKYDMSSIVQSVSADSRLKLQNKLHIYVSIDDPYGLDKSVRLFKDVLDTCGINNDIIFFEDLGHNVWNNNLREHIHNQIDSLSQF